MPPLVAMQARRGASRGMDLVTALDRCVAGYSRVWTFVLGEVSRCDLPAEQRFELLSQVSRVTSLILARIQAEVADAHSSEIKRKARSREQRTNEIVHKLLREEPVDAGELLELGYELDRWHLGVIAAGAQAMSAVRALAAGLGCELLTVTHGAEAVRAWLGGPRRIAFADIERIRSMQPSLDVALAIGEPGRGIKGWRQTHHEAEGALLVARNWPRKLTRYLDVATDAMVLQDDALADALIETYLSPLDEMRIGGETARRMMRALFDAEHNVSSAASALKVDRSTVHRQRNEIERRLGCRLHERQAEIEVALRVEDLRARHHAGKMA
ncbi:MAG TPA: hypothetical protein VMB51_11575 [Solirubrobacteraceae bacterium]|nr:hypothetical protein [Solirubrobacteraceae bacterium]